jgi:anti-anti-sigma factor
MPVNPDQVLDLIVLTHHNDPAATILQVVGDIDAHTAPLLREAVKAAAVHAVERVALDLSGVRYFSTAGAVVLLDAHTTSGTGWLSPEPRHR